MAIPLKVESLEAIPEIMREFVSEVDGGFEFADDKAFQALKNEREISKTTKAALSPFKALNMSADQLAAFVQLGKTPDEIAQLIAKANQPVKKPDVTNSTEYLELKKQVDSLLEMKTKYEKAEAENLKNKRNDLVRAGVRALSDEYDKELFGGFVEEIMDKFTLNETGDGLNPIDGKLPGDYLADLAKTYKFVKTSTPGNANPGNATMAGTGSTAFAAAKQSGDIDAMINAAPKIQ